VSAARCNALIMSRVRYMFTMQEGEEKFGPDPEEFRLSDKALARKAKRDAAAAAAAEAAAARQREEELGGVVEPRKVKRQKKLDGGLQEEEEQGRGKRGAAKVGAAPVGNGSDGVGDASQAAPLKKSKKNKAKVTAEGGTDTPRSYPDSVAWGDQGVALDGRIAAAIHDMVPARARCSRPASARLQHAHRAPSDPAAAPTRVTPPRASRPRSPSRPRSYPAPCATASIYLDAQKQAVARRWRTLCP
jgi:hypothetical protein